MSLEGSFKIGLTALADSRLSAVMGSAPLAARRAASAIGERPRATEQGPLDPRQARQRANELRERLLREALALRESLDRSVREQIDALAPLVCTIDWLTDRAPPEGLAAKLEALHGADPELRLGEALASLGGAQIPAAILAGAPAPEIDAESAALGLARVRLCAIASAVDEAIASSGEGP